MEKEKGSGDHGIIKRERVKENHKGKDLLKEIISGKVIRKKGRAKGPKEVAGHVEEHTTAALAQAKQEARPQEVIQERDIKREMEGKEKAKDPREAAGGVEGITMPVHAQKGSMQ